MRKVRLWLALMAILVATVAGAQSTITVTAAEYFFDTDPGYGKATVINNAVEGEQTLDIPTSALSTGAHTLCVRSLGSNGVWSSTMTKSVYVMHTGNNTYSVEYFFDNDPGYGKGNVLIIAGSQDVTIDIDTKDVTPGAHMLYLRSQDTNGNWSSVMAHPLYVFTILPVAALEYYIDNNDPGEGLAISVPVATATAATATFDIDTSVLTPGEHTLNIRAMGIDSVWTAVSTRTFTIEGPAEPEPYAAFSDDNTVLTFYYDTKKEERSGMGVGPFSPSISGSWGNKTSSITTVVFDESFASYTSLTSTSYWFSQCKKLTTIVGMENLNTSGVTKMDNMFLNCEALTSLDLSSLNTSEVTRMDGMIRGCTSLLEVNLSNFNTEKVESTNSMFYGCNSLKTIDLSSFATPKLSNTGYMFFDCTELTTIYASEEWTVEKVTESSLMFSYCNKLVGGMGTVFSNDYTGKQYARIDGGPSNPGYFTDKNAPVIAEAYVVLDGTTITFYYDDKKAERGGMNINSNPALATIPYGTATTAVFDTSFADYRPTSTSSWFLRCSSLASITGMENLKTDSVTNMSWMFYGCSNLTSLDVSGFNTAKATDMSFMFFGCSGLTSLDVSGFKTDNVTTMFDMFNSCSGLTSLDVSGFKTDNVTDMQLMFSKCSGLTSLDVSHFNTANVTVMNQMFEGCSSLTSLDVSGFKTDNVTDMSWMFYGCSSLTSLDVSGFKTDKVTSLWNMFNGCSGLTSLDLSGFNTANVTVMTHMFSHSSSLTTIYAGSEWSTAAVTDIPYMFDDCVKLVGGKGTAYDANHTDYTYAHIDGGPSNPGYFTDKNAPAEPEHYAVLTDNGIVINPEGAALPGKTLTFYYDTEKQARGGMSVGLFDLPQNREWESLEENITTVEFDASMANDTTITSTAYWFYGCLNLEYVYGIENLKTQNVTDMKYMFYGCNVLQEVELSGFNTANVTDMSGMFYKCHSLQNIDLTNFNTAKVTNMSWMFYNCTGVTKIYAGSYWTTASVTESEEMFVNCTQVVGSAGTTYDANHVDAAYAHIDGGPSNPGYLSDKNAPAIAEAYAVLSDNNTVLTFYYDTEKQARNGMGVGPFDYEYDGSGISGATIPDWYANRSAITRVVFDPSFADCTYIPSTGLWFFGFSNLTSIEGIKYLKTDNVTDMGFMFYGCSSLTSLDVSGFNTSKVGRFNGIFGGCSGLTSIDVSHFDTSNAWDFRLMFDRCSSLTALNISNFNTANVIGMGGMFEGCSSLKKLDLHNFNTEKVFGMGWMFSQCSALTDLDLSNFNTSAVGEMNAMFAECNSLVSLNISSFNTNNVTNMSYIFDGCTALASIQAGSAYIADSLYARIDNPNLLVYVNEASLAPQGVQNVVVNGVAQEIVLTDVESGNNNFFVPQSFTAGKVSYTRNFTQQTQPNVSRGWESISLPFNVQNIVHETKGALSPFGSSAAGKKFWLRRLADNGLTRVTQIVANVPYVISMPNSTEYTDLYNLSGRVTFSSENTTIPATTPAVLALADSSIVMMPTTLRVNRSSSVWAINVGEVRGQYLEGSVFERDYREVRPFEAYTVHRSNGPAPRFVPIVEMDSDATGIEDVRGLMSDGRGDQWYDLKGNKLQQKPTRKGVYILNGTKVVIK